VVMRHEGEESEEDSGDLQVRETILSVIRDHLAPVNSKPAAKSLVASSTQAESPWPCYSAPPLSPTAASPT
jgi:hypothetical protein